MRTPGYACQYCGSINLRRSRRQSLLEIGKMVLGIYPFRCLGCSQRVWVNVWLFSQLPFAKCPKCLGRDLTNWPRSHYRANLWSNLLMTFGAHRYRCPACRYNFLSFRPRQSGGDASPESAEKDAAEKAQAESETLTQKAGAIPESDDRN